MNIPSHTGDDYTRKTAAAEPSAADEARQEREERRKEYHPNLDGPAEPYALSIDANGNPKLTIPDKLAAIKTASENRVERAARFPIEARAMCGVAGAKCDIDRIIAEVERLRAICEKALQDLPDSWKVLLEANDPERSTL